MVGTFYRSSAGRRRSSKSASEVKEGETLCIIEAMKLLNEIDAESPAGHDPGENGQPVEFGQPCS